jgi:hypothetical protein
MDLVHNINKARTHFFAVALRRDPEPTTVRTYYSLFDAAVLPMTILEDKFHFSGDAFSEQPRNPLDDIRADRERRIREDGALGNVLVMSLELNPGEDKTVEQAVTDVSSSFFELGRVYS